MLVPMVVLLAAQPPAGLLPRFGDVPNVAVAYYGVAGRDLAAIHKAVTKSAPRDPQTGRVLPATSSWTVGVRVKSLTTGKRCTVTGAMLDFRAAATMPRLAPDPERPAPVAAAWSAYAAQLEARQAAQLRFAYERMAEVERAILASRCDRAEAAADAALARLREAQLRAFADESRRQPRLGQPAE